MFYPMFAMVLLTLLVAIVLMIKRFRAVKNKQVSIGYFRLNRGEQSPPPDVIATANHFSNLFEVPLLFYVACLLAFVWNFQPATMVLLGWIFVASRAVHAFIHITYNNVVHRMLSFAVSFLSVILIWCLLAAHVIARQSF
ncbi:MAPEG family protein [Cellvibrio polysaccharolyticus]|uniref:MAPEG family protein n=1 Tax=Cellvibrio polysaccharolyticus TaxID=2082724 RepID=A0A928YWL1_9GAMM|nr:MAPEG family protein [Cellvibrio polysaccharolyticus]MBE8718318.1 hypothetical protein [Cellvibrio polysaccharolyticus]